MNNYFTCKYAFIKEKHIIWSNFIFFFKAAVHKFCLFVAISVENLELQLCA